MAYPWLTPLLAAVVTLALAIFVYRGGPRGAVRDVFTFLACMLVLWNLNFFTLYSVADRGMALALTRVFRVGAIFLIPAIPHLFFVLHKSRPRWWWGALIADYGLACGLVLANAFDLFVSDLREFSWGYYSVGGRAYTVFSFAVIANFLAAIAVLIHDYRLSTEPRVRLQLKLWLLGALVALPLGLTHLLPAYGIPFYPLGNLGNAAWAGVVAYAIVRHRLMDIDIAVGKGMAYTAVSLVLIAPAFALLLWLQRLSFGQVHPDFSFAILVMLITVGVLFPVLRLRAESQIQRSLFRDKHEYRSALRAFTRSIVRILDREKLVHELTTTLGETLRLDGVAVALLDDSTHAFTICKTADGRDTLPRLRPDDALIACLSRSQGAILLDELKARPDAAESAVAAETCARHGWDVCIPLTAGRRMVGFIALGRKRNLDAFFAEDLELLETLAAEASVALENARLYEELKRSQEIIRRADRLSALGTLAAGIAHEVRNPLVSIQTFFQLAPDRLHDEEFFTTFLGMTASEVKRISDLITELLSFARSPTRTSVSVSLNDTVERVVTLMEPEAKKHRLTLTSVLEANVPGVRADADQVKQVLINLILNAVQATGADGSVTVMTRLVQRSTTTFGQCEVRDTGAGIPSDQLDHIFDPFFTTKDKGTGLGLAIAHQIVAEHGGLMTVESTEGRGTSFFVDLPAYLHEVGDETPAEGAIEVEAPLPRYARPLKAAS